MTQDPSVNRLSFAQNFKNFLGKYLKNETGLKIVVLNITKFTQKLLNFS
jgi:hypothetical protein